MYNLKNTTAPNLNHATRIVPFTAFLQSTKHYFSLKVVCNASNLLTSAFLSLTFAFPHSKPIMLFCLYTIYVSVAAPFKCQQNHKRTTSQFNVPIIVRTGLSAFIQASGRQCWVFLTLDTVVPFKARLHWTRSNAKRPEVTKIWRHR